ncbi:hypothetical protein BXP70_27080 [Hymenobacter crusticola]|uniref:Recombinase domain-containing protein n=1 Tax=Hymenobacter crusticola TaxID=1770526 RepID=A0A243W7E8_9BACT|nr:hypothetical protein BXP70_27080 [Hymenobacter crusticola]
MEQKEATAISTRTKDALAVKKAIRFQLSTPANLTAESWEKSWVSLQRNAQTNINNRQAKQLAILVRATGVSLQEIAARLNESGYLTRRGKTFHPIGVRRLLPDGTISALAQEKNSIDQISDESRPV